MSLIFLILQTKKLPICLMIILVSHLCPWHYPNSRYSTQRGPTLHSALRVFYSGMIQIPSVTIASNIFLYNMGGFIGGFWYLESNQHTPREIKWMFQVHIDAIRPSYPLWGSLETKVMDAFLCDYKIFLDRLWHVVLIIDLWKFTHQ